MEREWVSLRPGGPEAFVVLPETSVVRGAVVVGMEIFGVTAHVQASCQRLARAGYAAVAPDFYWRHGRRLELGYDAAGREQGMRLARALRREEVISDAADARALALRRAPIGTGTAAIGFSLGGHLMLLAATRIPFDLVASWYGGWTLDGGIPLAEPSPPLADARDLARNGTFFLGLVGTADHLVTPAEWQRIGDVLEHHHVPHELRALEGAAHGFACPDRPATFHAAATEEAWGVLLTTLTERLPARRGKMVQEGRRRG